MRILLPPSEAKSPGGTGSPLRTAGLGPEPLAATRRVVLDAVRRLCRDRPGLAVELLRIPPAVAEAALGANVAVLDAPTAPALDRFTGVLFDALSPGTLASGARARAAESVLVFDGAFGVLRGDEPVPDHRVPAAASLPDVGGVATMWRPVLAAALPPVLEGHVVVDLRSSDYAAMWRPSGDLDVIPVRILVDRGDGRPVVSSVPSKVGKGLLARALCSSRRRFRSRRDVETVAVAAGFGVLPAATGLDLLFDFVPRTAPR